MEHTRLLIEEIGLEGQRLQMINVSAAMGGQFAFAAAELTSEIERLGPSPFRIPGGNGRIQGKPSKTVKPVQMEDDAGD